MQYIRRKREKSSQIPEILLLLLLYYTAAEGEFISENETRIDLLMEPSARDTLAQANSGTIQAKPNLKTRAASRITSYNPQAGNQSIFPAPAYSLVLAGTDFLAWNDSISKCSHVLLLISLVLYAYMSIYMTSALGLRWLWLAILELTTGECVWRFAMCSPYSRVVIVFEYTVASSMLWPCWI